MRGALKMRTKLNKLIRFGVVGMAHAGKTTVCDAIIKELNRRFFVDGFLVGNVTRLKFAQRCTITSMSW
jgi:nucleoside-triphosphatase THEP1